MIQMQTMVDIADNTGAKRARCIHVLRGSTSRRGKFTLKKAGLGDIIVCSIRKALPAGEVKQGQLVRCVVVRCKHPTRRRDGSYVRFDSNAAVIIDEERNPQDLASHLLGPGCCSLAALLYLNYIFFYHSHRKTPPF